jgi:hypothetical protein
MSFRTYKLVPPVILLTLQIQSTNLFAINKQTYKLLAINVSTIN